MSEISKCFSEYLKQQVSETPSVLEDIVALNTNLIILQKSRFATNYLQGLILFLDSWCADLASYVFCWHSRVFLYDHFPPISYIPNHSRYCVWKTKQDMKCNLFILRYFHSIHMTQVMLFLIGKYQHDSKF